MTTGADGRSVGAALGLAWLSFASGSTDVLSYLAFGDVFTSAMTGNTALLAIAIGRGHALGASRSLTALLGFALGAAVAAALRGGAGDAPRPRRRVGLLLLLEIACLAACAALWTSTRVSGDGNGPFLVILLSAVGMGVQGIAARVIDGAGISTVVFTGVLLRIAASPTERIVRRAKAAAPQGGIAVHLGAFAAYMLGGLLAGMLIARDEALVVWLPVAAVVLALGSSLIGREPAGSG